ncbi:hypothetical protein JCM8547_009397 [Rhodosporidiobolus lusitaniae]
MAAPFPGLGQKIKSQYSKAKASGALLFTESAVVDLDEEVGGTTIPFEVRFAPALAKKPTKDDGEKKKDDASSPPPDPFAPPYIPDLYVAEDTVKEDEEDAGDQFVVLLNKFCVTPRHFLLVTKDFVKQTVPLSPIELFAAWSILKQLGVREKHLCFLNCGVNSGASQPHKHLQLIPLSNGVAPFDDFIESNKPKNTKNPFHLPLPYASFTALIDPPASASPSSLASHLGDLFLHCLDLLIDHLRRLDASSSLPSSFRFSDLSYNVILTQSYMHLVSRSKEKYTTKSGREISVNSLGFAGMVLVKEQEALEEIKEVGVLEVLKSVGYRAVEQGEEPTATDIEPAVIEAPGAAEDKEN